MYIGNGGEIQGERNAWLGGTFDQLFLESLSVGNYDFQMPIIVAALV